MSQRADSDHRSTLLFQRMANALARYSLVILLAFSLFGAILLISGKDPIQSYKEIITHTLGSAYGFSEVIVAMIPTLITALAVAVPSRVGLINVGGEGQLYIGAAFATWAALTFPNHPAWIVLPLMMLLGMLGGALWALVPGSARWNCRDETCRTFICPTAPSRPSWAGCVKRRPRAIFASGSSTRLIFERACCRTGTPTNAWSPAPCARSATR